MHIQMERLYKAAKESHGITGQSELARRLNTSPQVVKNWESRGISKQGAIMAEQVLGIPATFIMSGDEIAARLPVDMAGSPDLMPVKRVKFKLSAGVAGFAVEPEDGNGMPIFFRAAWFDRNGFNPAKLFTAKVNGASMEPSLYDGDLVVVNTADQAPADGEVFALNYEGELVIKRLRRDGGEWWACSDNADQRRFAPKRCMDGVFIIGRVVYKQSERI